MLNLRNQNYFGNLLGFNWTDMLVAIFYIIITSCIDTNILEMTHGVVLCSLLIVGVDSSLRSSPSIVNMQILIVRM